MFLRTICSLAKQILTGNDSPFEVSGESHSGNHLLGSHSQPKHLARSQNLDKDWLDQILQRSLFGAGSGANSWTLEKE